MFFSIALQISGSSFSIQSWKEKKVKCKKYRYICPHLRVAEEGKGRVQLPDYLMDKAVLQSTGPVTDLEAGLRSQSWRVNEMDVVFASEKTLSTLLQKICSNWPNHYWAQTQLSYTVKKHSSALYQKSIRWSLDMGWCGTGWSGTPVFTVILLTSWSTGGNSSSGGRAGRPITVLPLKVCGSNTQCSCVFG